MEQWSSADLDYIRRSNALRDYLIPTKSKRHGDKRRVLCPNCGRNDAEIFQGSKGDGAMLFRCWYCRASGDIVSAVAFSRGISRVDAIPVTMRMFGGCTPAPHAVPAQRDTHADTETEIHEAPDAVPVSEIAEYCRRTRGWLTPRSLGYSYLSSRGLDPDLMRNVFRLGYDERCDGLGSMKKGAPAIVMPFDGAGTYFSARFLRPVGGVRFTQPRRSKGARRPVFHQKQLYMDFDLAVITESELDALSLAQAVRALSDYHVGVLATSGAGNYVAVLDALRQRMTDTMLIIAFDNDDAGLKNSLDFCTALRGIACNAFILDTLHTIGAWATPEGEPCKDINDVLRLHGDDALCDVVRVLYEAPDVALIEPDALREGLDGASQASK